MTEPDNKQEEYVSTAPTTSALDGGKAAKGKDGSGKKKPDKSHPWRDNIEAVAISIVTIVLFKYFVLEAYKIPTGSMQPTLMGNEETGIFDRVIVDKFSYHVRDPERFEIAVFKYPLDSSKNFIKRIVGMPGERLFLKGGDAFIQGPDEAEPKVLRRPRPIQDAQLRLLQTGDNWATSGNASSWSVSAGETRATVDAVGSGSAAYPGPHDTIRDGYLDGYPLGVKDDISEANKRSRANDVSDLRIQAEVEADAATKSVSFIIQEGDRRLVFVLAGPAADPDTATAIVARGGDLANVNIPTVADAGGFQLKAGSSVDVEVQNLNDLLEFRIDGDLVASLEIPPAQSSHGRRHLCDSRVELVVDAKEGAKTQLADVQVWRDIFYTTDSGVDPVTDWQIPEDSYLVLGDNSQDSSDGRDWRTTRFQVVGDGVNAGKIIQGNSRELLQPHPESNPRYVPQQVGAKQIFFRDILGELHVLDPATVESLPKSHFSFVPRDLIRGRAVVVVWPLAWRHNVYRLKWVR